MTAPGEARKAMFAEREGAKVRCTLCPHLCLLEEGRDGICRVRGVRGGSLRSLVYGRPATVAVDDIESKELYHFHPGTRVLSLGTLGCNVLCTGCQNWQISHAGAARGEAEKLTYLSPGKVVQMAERYKASGVAWAFNEPAVWIEYVHDVAVACEAAGLYTVLATAGFVTDEAFRFVAPHIDAVRFDLKGFGGEDYQRFTKIKDPAQALSIAVQAKEIYGCHVEVVSNIVPGINDDDVSLRGMAAWIHESLGPRTPWHVTRFQPDFELSYVSPTPLATLDRAAGIGRKAGLVFVYVGNVQGHSSRHTVCPSCGRTAIRRDERSATGVWVRNGRCAFCGEDLNVV